MIPSGVLAASAAESARRIALHHLDSASAALGRMEDPEDSESLHDFRVGLRRLRTTLTAHRPVFGRDLRKKDLREVRRITRATGAARDSEVLLAWLASIRPALAPSAGPMVEHLLAELRRERDESYAGILTLEAVRFRKLEKRMRRRLGSPGLPEKPTDPTAVRSFGAVLGHLLPVYARQLAEAVSAVRTSEDLAAVHEARIRGKRLRYLIEPAAAEIEGVPELLDRLKGLQDALGDLRDAQLLELRIRETAGSGPGLADAIESGRAELRELLTREQSDRFARFESGWRGEETTGFLAEVEKIRHRIADATPDPLEIERKYLLSGRPDAVDGVSAREFEQGYLPGDRIQERLRRITEADRILHVRSLKHGTGLIRIELQEQIDPELFDRLWPLTEGRRLTKRRYRISDGGFVWEVDEFTDRDLWLAEVELSSAAQEVVPPEWLAPYVVREVTDEPEYLNVNLAR
ncbi:MAG: CHAD domain-containing protein [Gemmatimonadota bacterium]